MNFPQLLGTFGTGFSQKAAIQRTVNLYLSPLAQGEGENPLVMLKSPGLANWTTGLTAAATRGMLALNGHLFDVVGNTLYDLSSAKAILAQYNLTVGDGSPVTMAADPFNLAICSAGTLHRVFAGALSYPALPVTPLCIVFIKNYWVILATGSQQFYFTDDLSTWDPADVQTAEADPNNTLAAIEHQQELFIFGSRQTQPFAVTTNANTPFAQVDSGIIPEGILAPATLKASGRSLLWLAQNKDSYGHVIKLDGYVPTRISTPDVENAIRGYSRAADATGWTYDLNGQKFYRLCFPTANTTLEYNITQNHWVEIGYLNPATGSWEAHRGSAAVSAFGITLVGDRANGKIYQMSPDFYDDAGDPLRWLRRTPHIVNEHKRIDYRQLFVAAEMGVGLDSIASGAGYDPQMFLRWSDDGGVNWSNSYGRSMGKRGETKKRLYWGPLGMARDRVFELSGSAPVKVAITAGSFDATVLSD